MRREQNLVRDWEIAMNNDVDSTPSKPVPLSEYNGDMRVALVLEEATEFQEAWQKRDEIKMIDALADTIWVCLGAAVHLGVDLEQFWYEVAKSNFTKVGGPRRKSDGKYLKGKNYRKPDLKSVWKRLYGEASA